MANNIILMIGISTIVIAFFNKDTPQRMFLLVGWSCISLGIAVQKFGTYTLLSNVGIALNIVGLVMVTLMFALLLRHCFFTKKN